MKKLILPVVLAVIGTGAGVGAGIFLKPPADEQIEAKTGDESAKNSEAAKDNAPKTEGAFDYVKLNNQFIVPVVKDGAVSSLVVLSLSVEIEQGQQTAVFQREPKLRDAFLQVLFDHANVGGFAGAFTNNSNMQSLRTALRETAQRTLGDIANDVLITDIVRQDV
ncbi:flagellar basal body-associated FliL family protein [Pseudaestuariivita rosea]|uniref:flagellar basal body-associated FliL family protein n=1 Tax=Pseudaestuariivita rosea TaxID=2763263 RepID=UPI001ABA945A|nr:flagellar basal body-associated FliL family protein [Pseudaestuariivita rosea]